jgi:hypothetical protein
MSTSERTILIGLALLVVLLLSSFNPPVSVRWR